MSRQEGLYKLPTQETYPYQPREQRSVSHSSTSPFSQWTSRRKTLRCLGLELRVPRCYVIIVCLTMKSLRSAVDCTPKKKRSTLEVTTSRNKRLERSLQCTRSKVPYKLKNWQEPIKLRKFHLSRDLLTDRSFHEGSRILRGKVSSQFKTNFTATSYYT